MHLCRKCDTSKACDAFYVDRSKKCGHHTVCRDCTLAARKARYDADPDTARDSMRRYYHANRDRFVEYSRRRLYSMTMDDYEIRVVAQGGRCAICRTPEKLHVDHDHSTGQVRGLLCNNCNRALGLLRDDPDVLARAVLYLTGQGKSCTAHPPDRAPRR